MGREVVVRLLCFWGVNPQKMDQTLKYDTRTIFADVSMLLLVLLLSLQDYWHVVTSHR